MLKRPPSEPIRVGDCDYFGIPDNLFSPPVDLAHLLHHLNHLEERGKSLGIKRRCFGLGAEIEDLSFRKIDVGWNATFREIWLRKKEDIVVKEDLVFPLGYYNKREFENSEKYESHFRDVWMHFPVWGTSKNFRFLVMEKAPCVPFREDNQLSTTLKQVVSTANDYIPDSSSKNLGFIEVADQNLRYWATVDIEFPFFFSETY